MRRTILHVVLATMAFGALPACERDLSTSAPVVAAASNALIPVGPLPPRPFLDPNAFVQITAGLNHTCARKNNNTVYCWGSDDRWQAGRAATNTCSGQPCVNRPTLVMIDRPGGPGSITATTIDAGSDHTCILDTLNDAYCWGDGDRGQLGFAAGSYGPSGPVKVVGGQKFNLISAGSHATCASGATGVWCWGDGTIGTSLPDRAATPQQITTFSGFTSLATGDQHSCGVSPQNILCWGRNNYGQLANDPAVWPMIGFAIPAYFGGPYSRVTTEGSVTCAESTTGSVQCAGYNNEGELGNGQAYVYPPLYPYGWLPSTIGMVLHGVSSGPGHTCALDASNLAYCWGMGNYGQVGAPSANYLTPHLALGGMTYRAIAVGGEHTCAIGTDNHIYCWGRNNYGQLGTAFPGGWVTSPVQAIDP